MKPEIFHQSPEIKPINLDLLKSLRNQNFIYGQSPFWWGTDYACDPREYMSFKKFKSQLVEINTDNNERYFVYPNPKVPLTTIDLEVLDHNLTFMVTARPFHPKEIKYNPPDHLLYEFETAQDLHDYFQRYGSSENFYESVPLEHFLPHIRGLVVSKRNNNYFWYPINHISKFGEIINESLYKKNLSFLNIFQTVGIGDCRTYPLVEDEIMQHSDLFNTKKFLSLPNGFYRKETSVSAEEFIKYHQDQKNILFRYPIKIPEISLDLPLYITNHNIDSDEITTPLVYGVYLPGIITVKDEKIAKSISKSISNDLGIKVDVFVSKPRKGSPEQKRVSLEEI